MKKLENGCPALLIGSAATHIWFPEFREPPDYDFYCTPGFAREFKEGLSKYQNVKVFKHTRKKLVGSISETKFDFTISHPGSWIEPILMANYDSREIETPFGIKVKLAKPTTLRVIQEVLACFPVMWRKHVLDYQFLKEVVKDEYDDYEWEATMVGLKKFYKQYGPGGKEKLELIPNRYSLNELSEAINNVTIYNRMQIRDNLLEILDPRTLEA